MDNQSSLGNLCLYLKLGNFSLFQWLENSNNKRSSIHLFAKRANIGFLHNQCNNKKQKLITKTNLFNWLFSGKIDNHRISYPHTSEYRKQIKDLVKFSSACGFLDI